MLVSDARPTQIPVGEVEAVEILVLVQEKKMACVG
jgi:hypothetical protein